MNQKTKVLIFGNTPTKSDKRSLGGATVLTQEIISFLKKEVSLQITHNQIRHLWKPKHQIIDFVIWLLKFPFIIVKYDVISIHATKDMHFLFSPLLCLWLRLFKKKYTYHVFAGNFHKQYASKNLLIKKIVDFTILKANQLFFETKEMVSYFEEKTNGNGIWLPNSREKKDIILKRSFERKFVFISRILPCKGVEDILKASHDLPEDYTIDFYGPINNDYYTNSYFEKTKINYCGILAPEEVAKTIAKYNVMLLPTYCYGEGYPGTIIESLSVGVPIISTHFNAIPEIIEHEKNGILIPIKNSNALKTAILSFNEQNYNAFVIAASESFKSFNSEHVFNKFITSFLNE